MLNEVVAVAGRNKLKTGATFDAFERLDDPDVMYEVRGTDADTAVHQQPFGMIGLDEIRRGAEHRARAALILEKEARYGVGIENGLVPVGGTPFDRVLFAFMAWTRWAIVLLPWGERWLRRWLRRFDFIDLAFVCIRDSQRGLYVYSTSTGIPCPLNEAIESIVSRQRRTAGYYMAQWRGCDPADWHKELLCHRYGRAVMIREAVFVAVLLLMAGRALPH